MFVLKRHFKKLEERLDRLESEKIDLEKRIWLLENPFKFNVGQKVKAGYRLGCGYKWEDGVIVSRKQRPHTSYLTCAITGYYKQYEVLIKDSTIYFTEDCIK